VRIGWNDTGHPLLNFRATGDNRFDAPDASFETLYVADSLEVCFGETLLRGGIKGQPLVSGRTFVPEAEVACPTLIVRGVDSDLLAPDTVRQMTRRGAAAQAGLVRHVEFPDCGHAPALMDDSQVAVVAAFLAAEDVRSFAAEPRAAGGGVR
jgi:pimeloyl-ACP methyl ester carboxylesterase